MRVLASIYADPWSFPTSIAPEGGLLLYALIRNIRPTRTIETGTALGVSTIWISAALEANGGDAKMRTYDLFVLPKDPARAAQELFKDPKVQVERRLADAGLSHRVVLREGDSAHNLVEDRQLHVDAGGVQFAFLDGDHSPRGVLRDFQELENVLQVGGYVLLHDVFPEVCNQVGPRWVIDEGLDQLSGTYALCDIYLAQTNYGMTLLQRKS